MDHLPQSLVFEWRSLPAPVRSASATEAEIAHFEGTHGAIPPSFRSFLAECGGGVVGREWVDDISQLGQSHEKFKRERAGGHWQDLNGFLVGWDGAGNPIAIEPVGKVLVGEHNFGAAPELAVSYEEFLAKGLRNAL